MQDSFSEGVGPEPSLQHQQAAAFPSLSRDSSDDCSSSYWRQAVYGEASEFDDAEYEEAPVYRSIAHLFVDDDTVLAHAHALCPDECCTGAAYRGVVPAHRGDCRTPTAMEFHFELPRELFDIVLAFLPSHPALFHAMAVSRYWCEESRATYARRTVCVPPIPDALLQAAAAATPGDTLLLLPGQHWLSAELLVEKPLRVGAATAGATTVLATRCPSLLRTRAATMLNGLTLCRMGHAEGHPNAVIVADTGALNVEHCRITCGGTAPTIEQAMDAFVGAPPQPGGAWQLQSPPPMAANDGGGATRQGPQLGVYVGFGASVTMRDNIIAFCSGPGVKIYNGRLLAERNTLAFSRCGANVVANGGRVVLTGNAIHGARGDGVSSWNNSNITLDGNTIHSNTGAGVTIHAGADSVSIARNSFWDNTHTAVQFLTSNVRKVSIGEDEFANDWSRNARGGLQGLAMQPSSLSLREKSFGSPSALPALVTSPSGRGSAASCVSISRGSSVATGEPTTSTWRTSVDDMEVDSSTSVRSGLSVEMG